MDNNYRLCKKNCQVATKIVDSWQLSTILYPAIRKTYIQNSQGSERRGVEGMEEDWIGKADAEKPMDGCRMQRRPGKATTYN